MKPRGTGGGRIARFTTIVEQGSSPSGTPTNLARFFASQRLVEARPRLLDRAGVDFRATSRTGKAHVRMVASPPAKRFARSLLFVLVLLVAVSALLAGACGGASTSGSWLDADAASPSDAAVSLPDASLEAGDAAAAASCSSNVPCEQSAQCVTLPGTACDPASRRCVRLECLPAGEKCGRTSFCQQGLACAGSAWAGESSSFDGGTCTSVEEVRAGCIRGCETLESAYCSPAERRAMCMAVCNAFPWQGPQFRETKLECAENARVSALDCRGATTRSCSARLYTPCGRSIWTEFSLATCP